LTIRPKAESIVRQRHGESGLGGGDPRLNAKGARKGKPNRVAEDAAYEREWIVARRTGWPDEEVPDGDLLEAGCEADGRGAENQHAQEARSD